MGKPRHNEQAAEAVRSIEETVRTYAPGRDDAVTRQIIERLLDYIRTVANGTRPVDLDDRLAELRGWVDLLLSPRKHARHGGLERVRTRMLTRCEELRRLLNGRRAY